MKYLKAEQEFGCLPPLLRVDNGIEKGRQSEAVSGGKEEDVHKTKMLRQTQP